VKELAEEIEATKQGLDAKQSELNSVVGELDGRKQNAEEATKELNDLKRNRDQLSNRRKYPN
jgi:archaellum component FlaC